MLYLSFFQEKWDSMTRKWKDNCLLQLVKLFLIDEVSVSVDSQSVDAHCALMCQKIFCSRCVLLRHIAWRHINNIDPQHFISLEVSY